MKARTGADVSPARQATATSDGGMSVTLTNVSFGHGWAQVPWLERRRQRRGRRPHRLRLWIHRKVLLDGSETASLPCVTWHRRRFSNMPAA
jgi:alkanesulfonate monooxygenase SsuD/methylene tetrahydromethanopterin reductase-like flavin-dependent oxidoreductase (luciferase family)